MPASALTPPANQTPELELEMNQTEFAGNEPLFEDPVALPQTGKVVEKKKAPKLLFLVLAILWAVLMISLLVLVILPKTRQLMDQQAASPLPSASPVLTDQQKRLQELQNDLDNADPSKVDLPFPPVNLNLGFTKR